MNKSKIEWCDMTWNPITGCLHGCEYCYARRIAERFGPHEMELMNIKDCKPISPISFKNLGCYECDEPVYLTNFKGEKLRMCPYPQGFKPTFHKYRLDEPKKKTKGVKIFVCSMADLFGDWVPDEWIEKVFKTCGEAPQHIYMFLTKNPKRYTEYGVPVQKENLWYGVTITKENEMHRFNSLPAFCKTFVSMEPILENLNPEKSNILFKQVDWVIIGAETGNRKDKIIPKREWIEDIVKQCRASDVPVFMKNSLKNIWKEDLIQEFPKEMEGKNE